MTPPRQITDLDDLAGKTIARVFHSDRKAMSVLGLVFVDGTFLRIVGDTDYGSTTVNLVWKDEPDDDEKVAFGLVSQEDYDRVIAERARLHREAKAARERAEYERLRAKFEGGGT